MLQIDHFATFDKFFERKPIVTQNNILDVYFDYDERS